MNNNITQIKDLGVNFIVHRINPTNLPIIRDSGLKVIANNWHSEFDHSGKMIAELVNTVLEPGEFSHTFRPESHLASGVYFIELVSGVYRAVQKTMYLK